MEVSSHILLLLFMLRMILTLFFLPQSHRKSVSTKSVAKSSVHWNALSRFVSREVSPPPAFNIQSLFGFRSGQASNTRVPITEALRGSMLVFVVPYCVKAALEQRPHAATSASQRSLELVCTAEVIGCASGSSYTHLYQQKKELCVNIIYSGAAGGWSESPDHTPRGCHFKAICLRLPKSACLVR